MLVINNNNCKINNNSRLTIKKRKRNKKETQLYCIYLPNLFFTLSIFFFPSVSHTWHSSSSSSINEVWEYTKKFYLKTKCNYSKTMIWWFRIEKCDNLRYLLTWAYLLLTTSCSCLALLWSRCIVLSCLRQTGRQTKSYDLSSFCDFLNSDSELVFTC